MMIRTAGSERSNSLSGYHIADPCAARMTILPRRSESMEATGTRLMGCANWVGSQIRQRLAGLEECILLCWRSTSTVYEEIPSVCSQSIDPTVDVGILLVCCGSYQELCLTHMQHVLTLTMGLLLSKLAMSIHEDACRWQCQLVTITCMAISSKRWAELRLRGQVRAGTEACRVRTSRCI